MSSTGKTFNKEEANVTSERVIDQLKGDRPPILLDVREADEWEEQRIPGSVWIPLQQLPERVSELPQDRPIVCVCLSGGRSMLATEFLFEKQYDAVNLKGGLIAWTGDLEKGE